GASIFSFWGKDTAVQGLAFNDPNQWAAAIRPYGTNIVVRDCVFLKIGDGINCNPKPKGVLAMDNTEGLVDGLRNYMIWSQGSDQVFLGNTCPNSVQAHDI